MKLDKLIALLLSVVTLILGAVWSEVRDTRAGVGDLRERMVAVETKLGVKRAAPGESPAVVAHPSRAELAELERASEESARRAGG